MIWKGWDFFPHDARWPFIRLRQYAMAFSAVLVLVSVGLFLARGLNFGIDFAGGTLIEVQTKNTAPVDIGAIRSRVSGLGLGDVQIQGIQEIVEDRDCYGGDCALIRVEAVPGGEKEQQLVVTKVREALGDEFNYRRTEVVGPTVSGELKETGTIAVICAILAVLAYLWFRFEWQFAVGAVAALVHDVVITIGLFALLQLEFSLNIVAALLTIVGYSLNDTVVVFDRVRENLRKYKKMPLATLLDQSINETMSRTILTSGTTLVALLALYIFGTEVIRGFVFAMIFGIVIGTYSSIYIASPTLLVFGVKRDWSGLGAGKAKEPANAS